MQIASLAGVAKTFSQFCGARDDGRKIGKNDRVCGVLRLMDDREHLAAEFMMGSCHYPSNSALLVRTVFHHV